MSKKKLKQLLERFRIKFIRPIVKWKRRRDYLKKQKGFALSKK